MIDTDKYEGHTEGEWYAFDGTDTHGFGWEVLLPTHKHKSQSINVTRLDKCIVGVRKNTLSEADAQLIADAPLLLEEVKRLRGRHVAFMQWMIEHYDEIVNEWEASE
jgi:hypothetical protein